MVRQWNSFSTTGSGEPTLTAITVPLAGSDLRCHSGGTAHRKASSKVSLLMGPTQFCVEQFTEVVRQKNQHSKGIVSRNPLISVLACSICAFPMLGSILNHAIAYDADV